MRTPDEDPWDGGPYDREPRETAQQQWEQWPEPDPFEFEDYDDFPEDYDDFPAMADE